MNSAALTITECLFIACAAVTGGGIVVMLVYLFNVEN